MKITDVQIKIVTTEAGRLKAVASVVLDDCFAIHDIKIIDGKDGVFIAMPSKKAPNGDFKDIVHPINTETREMFCKEILDAYKKAEKEVTE